MIPWVFAFRIALSLNTLTYHFNPILEHIFVNSQLWLDSLAFLCLGFTFFLLSAIKHLHHLIKLLIGFGNLMWLPFGFWICFYYNIINDPDGRSIFQMLCNPQYTDEGRLARKRKKVKTIKKQRPLRFYNARHLILSSPASQGAYANVDEKPGKLLLDFVLEQLREKQIYYHDPLRLSVPYDYLKRRLIEPPDGYLYDLIILINFCGFSCGY